MFDIPPALLTLIINAILAEVNSLETVRRYGEFRFSGVVGNVSSGQKGLSFTMTPAPAESGLPDPRGVNGKD